MADAGDVSFDRFETHGYRGPVPDSQTKQLMQQPSNVRIFNPPQIHKPVGYSHVAEITQGKMIYVAGQVALDASGNLVGKDDLGAQTRQVFANLKTALEAAGADFSNVVKLNYYLVETVDPAEI